MILLGLGSNLSSSFGDRFKNIDLAMLNYNAAGPYPSCFDNLSTEEKINENKRLSNRRKCQKFKILQLSDLRTK